MVTRDEFLDESSRENVHFGDDMEEGNYSKWVDKYPDHIIAIFGAYLDCGGGDQVTKDGLKYFKERGIDLNSRSNAYWLEDNRGHCTPLGLACSKRNSNLIRILIDEGAKVNVLCYKNDTYIEYLLDYLFVGHVYGCRNPEGVEECLKILEDAGVKKIINKSTFEKDCRYYVKFSQYMKEFIEKCEVVEDES